MQASPLRFSNPSRQRAGLRDKHVSFSRPRIAHDPLGGDSQAPGSADDCVFKRFPAIGDTPVAPRQQG